MLAGNSGHTDVVQLLLSSGAKIDLQNKVRHDIQPITESTSVDYCVVKDSHYNCKKWHTGHCC